MTSRTYSRPNGLSENQLNAVESVLAGSSDTQTAQRIGIARETVTRWRNYGSPAVCGMRCPEGVGRVPRPVARPGRATLVSACGHEGRQLTGVGG